MTLAFSLGAPPAWLPLAFAGLAIATAAILAAVLFFGIRADYLAPPTAGRSTGSDELDPLTRLLASFARVLLRMRRIMRVVVGALVVVGLLGASFAWLGYEYLNNRCVPYQVATTANQGNRHLWEDFVLTRSQKGTNPPSPALVKAFKAEVQHDFPDVACPK